MTSSCTSGHPLIASMSCCRYVLPSSYSYNQGSSGSQDMGTSMMLLDIEGAAIVILLAQHWYFADIELLRSGDRGQVSLHCML